MRARTCKKPITGKQPLRGKWMIRFYHHSQIHVFSHNLRLDTAVIRVEITHSHGKCRENGEKKYKKFQNISEHTIQRQLHWTQNGIHLKRIKTQLIKQTVKHRILAMFLEGGQTRPHCGVSHRWKKSKKQCFQPCVPKLLRKTTARHAWFSKN